MVAYDLGRAVGDRYIGNAAVFDFGKYSLVGGLVAMYAWRGVYWSEQVSSRTRALLMMDWILRCAYLVYLLVFAIHAVAQGYLGTRPIKATRVGGR